MEELKKEIVKILISNEIDETSSTGTTGEKIISGGYDEIAKDICNLIQAAFDPENQPNQFGIKKEEYVDWLSTRTQTIELEVDEQGNVIGEKW